MDPGLLHPRTVFPSAPVDVGCVSGWLGSSYQLTAGFLSVHQAQPPNTPYLIISISFIQPVPLVKTCADELMSLTAVHQEVKRQEKASCLSLGSRRHLTEMGQGCLVG